MKNSQKIREKLTFMNFSGFFHEFFANILQILIFHEFFVNFSQIFRKFFTNISQIFCDRPREESVTDSSRGLPQKFREGWFFANFLRIFHEFFANVSRMFCKFFANFSRQTTWRVRKWSKGIAIFIGTNGLFTWSVAKISRKIHEKFVKNLRIIHEFFANISRIFHELFVTDHVKCS